MRAVVYHAPGDVRVEEVERPSPGPGELLVEMRACGVCGSDLLDWYIAPRAPFVMGHEPVGVVAETGPPTDGPLPDVGARVFVHHHVPCMNCERCLRGHETLCDQFRKTNIQPGGFAEFIRVPALNVALDVLPIPDNVSDAAATAIEPLACVVRGQRRAGIENDTRLLVVGGGQIGLLNTQAALAAGATVAVAEPLAGRRGLADRLGARGVEPDPNAVIDALGGRPTVAMLCTGADAGWTLALEAMEPGGTIQLFAPAKPGATRSFDVNDVFFREIQVQASYSAGPDDTRAALELIASGAVKPEELITHRFPLDDAAAALDAARSHEAIKAIVIP
ncbi:MAG: alcohol dehydrogenase catalytic domain-containing protein [Thermoleophilaceae bacterium]